MIAQSRRCLENVRKTIYHVTMMAETVKRTELVERLQNLAESKPLINRYQVVLCYDPFPSRKKIEIPCPNCKRAMIVGEKDEILREYNIPFTRIQDHGVEAKLIVPEHCPQCGFGLQKAKFQLEIKYPDHPAPVQVELDTAHDLELMALFLQGEDRYVVGPGQEKALKGKAARLRKLFGVTALPINFCSRIEGLIKIGILWCADFFRAKHK